MINIIVGNNAIGKTCLLKRIGESNNAVSNIYGDEKTSLVPINSDKINLIAKVLGSTYKVIDNNDIIFGDTKTGATFHSITSSLRTVLTIMCKEGEILLLDEPDASLNLDNLFDLIFILDECGNSLFKEIWIATHNQRMLNIEDCKCFTVSIGNLVEIDKDEAYEYVNTI